MPYTMQWLVENRVILTTFTGVVLADEIVAFVDELAERIAQGTPLVHHISYSLDVERMGFNLKVLQAAVRGYKQTPDFGWHLEVTDSAINRMMSTLSNHWAHTRSRTYMTLEDAIAFLKHNDPTLDYAWWGTVVKS